ncbi:uncharacterized protein LOC113798815 isoform X3 [Dermatophagoides pteronyssinus]
MESRANLKVEPAYHDGNGDDHPIISPTRKCSIKNLKKTSQSSSAIRRSKSLHDTKCWNGMNRSLINQSKQQQQQQQQLIMRNHPINSNKIINGHHYQDHHDANLSNNAAKQLTRTSNISLYPANKQQPTISKWKKSKSTKEANNKIHNNHHHRAKRTQSFNIDNNNDQLRSGSFSSGNSISLKSSSGSIGLFDNNLYQQMSLLSLQSQNNHHSSSNNSITTAPATYNGFNDLHEIQSIFLNCGRPQQLNNNKFTNGYNVNFDGDQDVYGDSKDHSDDNDHSDDSDEHFYNQNSMLLNNKLTSSYTSCSNMSINNGKASMTNDQTINDDDSQHVNDKKHYKSTKHNNRQQHRFYIIKQQNYPPLYLNNSCNRKRIHRIIMIGYPNVGKSSLTKQFRQHLQQTCWFNPANCNEMNDDGNLFIHFVEMDSMLEYNDNIYHGQQNSSIIIDYQPDVYLIMFSVNDRESFNYVRKALIDIQHWDDVENKIIIIVANKCDLERSRCVNRKEAKKLATENDCKYIEISCTISHNIHTLLQGIGAQITLKNGQLFNNHHHHPHLNQYPKLEMKHDENEALNNNHYNGDHVDDDNVHFHHQQVDSMRIGNDKSSSSGGLKRRESFLKRILRKAVMSKSKSCDNLHVL